MRKFKILAKNGFKTAIVYRAHFFVGLIRVPITLLIYYYLWKSIFAYSGVDAIQGYTFSELLGYYVISMLVGIFTYTEVDDWMAYDIRTGTVVADFLRPIAYIWNIFSVSFGLRIMAFIVEAIPTLLIAVFLVKVPPPHTAFLALFVVSLILAFFMNYFLNFCIGLLAFWFYEIQGIRKVKDTLMAFLEGSLIPLTFFPVFFQGLFKYLPFQYLRFTPVSIFLEKYSLNEVYLLLAVQLLWTGIFYAMAKFFFRKGFRKFAGAGV